MMDDLISRQAAIDIVSGYAEKFNGYIGSPNDSEVYAYARGLLLSIERNINAVPSAQIERKTGMWIKNEDRHSWHCSACMEDNFYAYSWNSETGREEFQDQYCPNCGASMDGGKEDA